MGPKRPRSAAKEAVANAKAIREKKSSDLKTNIGAKRRRSRLPPATSAQFAVATKEETTAKGTDEMKYVNKDMDAATKGPADSNEIKEAPADGDPGASSKALHGADKDHAEERRMERKGCSYA